jgi:hypothetical protein
MLGDPNQLMRLLLMILADGSFDPNGLGTDTHEKNGSTAFSGLGLTGTLLESLMRALAHEPERIDHVAKILDGLLSSEEGRCLLPQGLMESIWPAVTAARDQQRR